MNENKDVSLSQKTSFINKGVKRYLRLQYFAVMGLFFLAAFYTFYIAKIILLPITIAFLLSFLLAPLIRILKKLWIPVQISSIMIIFIIFTSLGFVFYQLSGPAGQLLADAPKNLSLAVNKVNKLAHPFNDSIEGYFKIQQFINQHTPGPENKIEVVAIQKASLFSNTLEFFVELAIVILLLYFLLSSNDFFLRKLVEISPDYQNKKEAVIIVHEIENKISSFLLIKILISSGLTILITLAMLILGMPHPFLWGVSAGVFEFIPYMGILTGTFLITVVSILTFDNFGQILIVPTCYFLISSIVGNIVAPFVLGRNLFLHPVIIFVSILLWGMIWGIVGAFIAVPLISVVKIILENIPRLQRFSKFLGE